MCSVRAWGKGLGEGSGGGGEGGEPPPLIRHSCRAGRSPGRVSGIICTADARRGDTQRRTHTRAGRAGSGAARGCGSAAGGALCAGRFLPAPEPPPPAAAAAAAPAPLPLRPGTPTPPHKGVPPPARLRTPRAGPRLRGPPIDRPPPPPPPRVVPSRRGSTKGRSGGERGGARTRGPAGGRGGAMQMRPRSPMASARAAAPTRSRAAAAAPGPPRRGFEPRPRRPAPHRRSMGRGRGGSCGRDMAGGRGCPARR